MGSALHIYIDPCATPAQLRLLIKEYRRYVSWIGILGRAPWLEQFEDSANGIEVIKGEWYLTDDRNRLSSLTPVGCDYILWLYASDRVTFPQHLLVRGSEKIDCISAQVALNPDYLARTIRYRYYPRLIATEYFKWHGAKAPYLKFPENIKSAINRKSLVESRISDLPVKIESYQDLSFIEYNEILELIVFNKLTLMNSLLYLINMATKEDLDPPKRSLLLAQAAKFLIDDGQVAEAKEAMTTVVNLGHLTIFHFFILAQIAFKEKEYGLTIELVNKALSEPWPNSEFPLEPVAIRTRLCEIYALSAIELKLPEEAKASLLEVEQFAEVSESLTAESKQVLADLCGYQPPVRTSKIWPEKSIVYFCGKGLEPWDDSSLKTGIGGSETAVIHLSRQWARAGYQVTIFGSPLSEHRDDYGVEWLEHSKCYSKDTFNIFISWRNFELFDQPVKAKLSLIDCHDILSDSDSTALRLSRIHKLMIKSRYHRDNLTGLCDEQFEIISNGIDTEDLQIQSVMTERKLKKVIYASSYDRGLESMLRHGWPRVIARHPDAELHLYYGWEGYDKMPDPTGKRAQWKRQMLQLFRQPGVFDHGRVGHSELLKQKMTASVHYYGCEFEEIDCISVRESAAAGCLPVSTYYAALAEKEYLLFAKGDPRAIETQKAVADVVSGLLGKDLQAERARAATLARAESWQNIAQKWIDLFEKSALGK